MGEEATIDRMDISTIEEIEESEESAEISVVKKRRTKGQDIGKYINVLRLPEEVKIRAADIKRTRMNVPTKRGSNLNKLIFFCVYNAYEELGLKFDKHEIAELCGVNAKDICRILRMFPEISTGYKAPVDDKNPLYYIPILFDITKLHRSKLPDIISITERILYNKHYNIDAFPETVALGIILYYMDINGIPYDINEISKKYAISTITTMKKNISIIDNK